MKRIRHRAISCLIVFVVLLSITAFSIDREVKRVSSQYIDLSDTPEVDAILILGAYVLPSGTVSTMLNNRLATGYELYKQQKAPKITVSGDHGRKDYDEVNAMKDFLKGKGVPSQDIFMDHAGFSTYEIMREVMAERVIRSIEKTGILA